MRKRRYVSSIRSAEAAAGRARLIAAAAARLRQKGGIAGFSLDAVARSAGVTRLTVYNQFGSRRGLLEAVFDDIAARGGLARLGEAMAMADAHAALTRLIEIFCAFWAGDRAVGRLHEAISLDPEFAEALRERNERRRKILGVLVGRIIPTSTTRARKEAVDLIFAMTSQAVFAMLRPGRSTAEVTRLITSASFAALDDRSADP